MASSEAALSRSRTRRAADLVWQRCRTGWDRMTSGLFQAVQMTVAAVGAYIICLLYTSDAADDVIDV